MSKLQPDLQKFVIISAAVTGIGLFWWQTTINCYKTVVSMVKNQLFVDAEEEEEEEEEWEEGEDAQQLLIRLDERKQLEDEKIRLLVKG